jgi:pSer/pThr/pTyr-binding forkhead associated (FHA) protein
MSTLEATAILAPNQEMVLQVETDKGVQVFDLGETVRVSVGRHPSNDIRLRSRRVSSYHAEILSEVEGLFVRDMGSTNGTCVNDKSIQRKKLSSGDCIQICGFSLTVRLVPRVEESRRKPETSVKFAVGSSGSVLPFRSEASSAEEGREPSEATLPEILTELSREKRSSVVVIRDGWEEGRIYIREGAVIHAEHGSARSQKALYRLLALEGGTYEIRELPQAPDLSQTIRTATDELVVEGMQQAEALAKISAKLPGSTDELLLNETCGIPVNTLTSDELEIYKRLIRWRTVGRTVDESDTTDFMALLLIHALLQKGFFRKAKSPGMIVEQTVIPGPQSA